MDKFRFTLVFIIGFIVYYYIDSNFFSILQKEITSFFQINALGHILAYIITLIPLILTVLILHKSSQNILEKFGIATGLYIGIAFAFLCTLPMLIGYALKFNLNMSLSIDTIIIKTISAAFFEEFIYRAFLFGQLYRFTRLGFLPSLVLSSSLFAIGHLYQSTNLNELAGIFAVTFLGSVLFSWIYAEWKFNLWTAIFLHCLMNLYWLIFEVDDNSLGGIYSNIFRFLTILIAILGTIIFKRKMKTPFEITKRTWWIKPKICLIVNHRD